MDDEADFDQMSSEEELHRRSCLIVGGVTVAGAAAVVVGTHAFIEWLLKRTSEKKAANQDTPEETGDTVTSDTLLSPPSVSAERTPE